MMVMVVILRWLFGVVMVFGLRGQDMDMRNGGQKDTIHQSLPTYLKRSSYGEKYLFSDKIIRPIESYWSFFFIKKWIIGCWLK